MANLSRANDAAARFNESLARELRRQKPSEAPYSDLNPGRAGMMTPRNLPDWFHESECRSFRKFERNMYVVRIFTVRGELN
jgi:hypothetical protein